MTLHELAKILLTVKSDDELDIDVKIKEKGDNAPAHVPERLVVVRMMFHIATAQEGEEFANKFLEAGLENSGPGARPRH